MRKFLVSIVVIVIILAGGYTAVWYKKSADFKQALERTIADLNARYQDPDHKDVPFIHYDALHVSGFPTALTFTFDKPVFNYSTAMLAEAQRMLNIPPVEPPAFNWRAEFASQGNLVITSNLLMNDYTVKAEGETRSTTLINNAARHVVAVTTDGPTMCHLNITNPINVPTIQDATTLLNVFREMNCSSKGMHITDATNNTPLGSTEAVSFDLKNTPAANGIYTIGVKMEEKNAQSTAAYDVILSDYMTILYAQMPTLKDQGVVKIDLADYGQRNITFDAQYQGPLGVNTILSPDAKWCFDLNNYDVTNALFTSKNKMHINVDNRTIDFSLHTDGIVTPRYDTIMNAQIADTLKNIAQKSAAQHPAAPATMDPALLFNDPAFVQAVIPTFSKLGQTSTAIDLKVKIPDNKTQQALTINAFDLSATPYGLALKGNIERGMLLPVGDLTLTCRSCDALLLDLGHYLAGIEKAGAQYKPAGSPLIITDSMIGGVIQFVHSIAEKTDTPDVTIHLVVKNTGEMSVSGKQPNQVMILFSTLVGPYLKAASATPPATAQPAKPSAAPPR